MCLPGECSDFFVVARTPYAFDTILTHVRLTHVLSIHAIGDTQYQTPSTEVRVRLCRVEYKSPGNLAMR
jgi:hypothetical protein